ncbi:MAG: universal stress protein [Melioribacteraceae bacterium]|nr:universal stress protein [Melioribacteraceae bacterium]MCF8265633.1 universal stress protein [Melioribacteraceae bacterium]MCF8414400.1 universal stress protein [Melioribacteraceae bacterium]
MAIPVITFKHVLFATDLSTDSGIVFSHARAIANQFNAKLTLVHVLQDDLLDLLIFDVGIDRLGGVQSRLKIVKDHVNETKDAILKQLEDEFGTEAVKSEDIVVEVGNPVKTLLNVARKRKCDIIVMGVQGRSSLDDATMGDTVRRVLHRTELPVLVVHNVDQKVLNGE